jgi:hypothetical protein
MEAVVSMADDMAEVFLKGGLVQKLELPSANARRSVEDEGSTLRSKRVHRRASPT